MPIERVTPPTAEELGLMQGSPPVAEATVTLANWWHPPYNRWGLQHIGELMPTARIPPASASRALRPLDPAPALASLTFDSGDERWTVGEMVDATYTDGFLVLHRGAIAMERYDNGLTPQTTHNLFSVTKSVVATLTGILVGRGALSPNDRVADVIPELASSSWADATVQHVLDMRTGTRFTEDYADEDGDMAVYTVAVGMGPRTHPSQPTDTYSFLAGLPNDREHGGAFDYRSAVTSMLGWICERAGGARLATLLGRHLWGPMGAEQEASIVLDAYGAAMAAGGMTVTLRDLGRFGQLWLDRGRSADGKEVVSASWVDDTMAGGPDSGEAFAASRDGADPNVEGWFYRNQWWVMDPRGDWSSGIGIHGQFVTVHRPTKTVFAKLSSFPESDDPEAEALQFDGFRAIAEALTRQG